jgi:hypothetical protein
MTDSNIQYTLKLLDNSRRMQMSRDREVFATLVQLHSYNEYLLENLSNVITYMCKLQPPELVIVSFAVEVDWFLKSRSQQSKSQSQKNDHKKGGLVPLPGDLRFASAFVQHLCHVLLNMEETKPLRDVLKDCIAFKGSTEEDLQRSCLFQILLHSFAHNIAATLSLCLWVGAYRTAFQVVRQIDPLDIDLIFLLELDRLVEMLERPLYRYVRLHPTIGGSLCMFFTTTDKFWFFKAPARENA